MIEVNASAFTLRRNYTTQSRARATTINPFPPFFPFHTHTLSFVAASGSKRATRLAAKSSPRHAIRPVRVRPATSRTSTYALTQCNKMIISWLTSIGRHPPMKQASTEHRHEHSRAQQPTTTHNNPQQHTTTHNNTQQPTTTHNNNNNNPQQQQQQQRRRTPVKVLSLQFGEGKHKERRRLLGALQGKPVRHGEQRNVVRDRGGRCALGRPLVHDRRAKGLFKGASPASCRCHRRALRPARPATVVPAVRVPVFHFVVEVIVVNRLLLLAALHRIVGLAVRVRVGLRGRKPDSQAGQVDATIDY